MSIQRELSMINKEMQELGTLSTVELNLLAGNYRRKLEMIDVVMQGLHSNQAVNADVRTVKGAETR